MLYQSAELKRLPCNVECCTAAGHNSLCLQQSSKPLTAYRLVVARVLGQTLQTESPVSSCCAALSATPKGRHFKTTLQQSAQACMQNLISLDTRRLLSAYDTVQHHQDLQHNRVG